ncbi:MAG: TonB-dependent receptor, partial [Bacteroidales bacterium]
QPVRELKEVFITSTYYLHNINSPLGQTIIPVKQIISLPALGEPDLIKSIQTQPGIKGGIEGSAGVFVRGGSAGENLFMLDDVPMYNVSHLFGFFSTFNNSAIKDIKLMKGCFPARYGGRTSSVVVMRSQDGNNKSIKGEISLGIISSKFTLEGPLITDKTTFIVSGRRSYFDLYSGILKRYNLLDNNFPGYYFYDLNARLSHTFSQYDKIYLSIYKGKDHIENNNGASIINRNSEQYLDDINETAGWGNMVGSLRWNHTFSNSLFLNTTFAYSSYNYFTSDKFNLTAGDSSLNKTKDKNYSASYNSAINDLIIKTDFEYSVSNFNKLSFGAGNTFHIYNPGKQIYSMNDKGLSEKIDTSFINSIIHTYEPFIYIEDEIKATKKLFINVGLRLSGLLCASNISFNLEPRFSANYAILPELVLKTGYSRMIQYMHMLSTSGMTVPTDLWVPSLNGLQPLKSDQINAGIAFNLDKKALFSIEIYRKWLTNTTDYRNGASLLTDLTPWYEKTTQGHGNAKGVEISIEKQEGRFTGTINYTLSTTDRKYSDLNNGQTFLFMYNRLHDFNISLNYQITKKWDISVLWLYGSGYPVTIPVEKYMPILAGITNNQISYFPSLNNCRLPSYHRLDLGIHYKTNNRLGEHTISFDIFNAYARKNPINFYYDYNKGSFIYINLLPIIPSVTYSLKFK